MKTLQLLKDYAGTTDNIWLQNQLDILELEIDCEIIKGKMQVQSDSLKIINEI